MPHELDGLLLPRDLDAFDRHVEDARWSKPSNGWSAACTRWRRPSRRPSSCTPRGVRSPAFFPPSDGAGERGRVIESRSESRSLETHTR
jgi:hypothetical protein